VKPEYVGCASLSEALRVVAGLAAATVVFDVEPLIAHWDTGQDALDEGVKRVLAEIAPLPSVLVLCFATNSSRRPSFLPASGKPEVIYIASAGKPLHTAPYKSFPAPGVLIGDQVLTDGILARRLGYTFVHCMPAVAEVPPGPWLLQRSGQLIQRRLFTGAGKKDRQPPHDQA
jgi:predicted HAD superfamily phosphohydrolase YqeG